MNLEVTKTEAYMLVNGLTFMKSELEEACELVDEPCEVSEEIETLRQRMIRELELE